MAYNCQTCLTIWNLVRIGKANDLPAMADAAEHLRRIAVRCHNTSSEKEYGKLKNSKSSIINIDSGQGINMEEQRRAAILHLWFMCQMKGSYCAIIWCYAGDHADNKVNFYTYFTDVFIFVLSVMTLFECRAWNVWLLMQHVHCGRLKALLDQVYLPEKL